MKVQCYWGIIMNEIIDEDFQDNKELHEPELVTSARKQLDFIELILIASRVLIGIFYCIFSSITSIDISSEAGSCVAEIIGICIFFSIIKNGHKNAAILPLIGGFISLSYAMAGFSEVDNFISIGLIVYLLLISIFQIISMIYILWSKKITFYCNYTLFNKSSK